MSITRTPRLWLYLYFPDQYLHSLFADENRPLVITTGQPPRLLQLNQAALKAGLQADLTLASAMGLCPHLLIRPHSPRQEQQALEQKALWANQFAASIYLDPPDGLWLEVGTMLQLFGGLEALWQQIRNKAQTLWPLQAGCDSRPARARLLARSQPDASLSANTDHNREHLYALPIQQLDISAADQLVLERVGVRTLQALRQLPKAQLAARVSPALMLWLTRFDSMTPDAGQPFVQPPGFSQRSVLLEDIEQIEILLFPLRPLLMALCGYLHQHHQATRQLQIIVSHREGPASHWELGLAHAEQDYEELLRLCRYRLGRQSLRAPVTSIELRVEQFEEWQPQQLTSFDHVGSNSGSYTQDHLQLINRLLARLQQGQLQRLASNADARPEHACTLLAVDQSYPHHIESRPISAPLWLVPSPIACPRPPHLHGSPLRIGSGWWDDHAVCRDYFKSRQQGWLWVFRQPDQHWYIQGYWG